VQNCAQVFKFAILTSRAEINVAENIKGFLPAVKEKHHAAIIEPKKVGSLLNAIDNASGTIATRCAIRFMPLVFVRSLELRRAEWKDIDFKRAEWSLHITKTDTPHIVPLSKQAIKVLKEIQPITGSGQYIFASEISKSGYLSENTMLRLLRELGISKEEMSIHGFRAMARTILHERLNVDPVIIEHQLAHKVPDALGRAYNRTQFLEQRKKMMQTWADYLDDLKNKGR
jgi:integrase